MKLRTKNNLIVLIIPAILIVTMIIACVVYGNAAAKSAEASAFSYAEGDVNEHIATLGVAIEGRFNTLEASANMLAGDVVEFKSSDVAKMLSSLRDGTFFVDIFIVDRNGIGYSSDGTTFDASSRRYYLRSMAGLRTLERVSESRISGEERFVFCVPIMTDGKFVGAILGTAKTENFRSLLYTKEDSGCSIITDNAGYIIVEAHDQSETPDDAVARENMLDAFAYSATLSEKVAHDLALGRSSSVVFSHSGQTRYAVYKQLSINGWMLFNVLPENVITSAVAKTTRLTYTITFIIITISVVLLGYLAISFGKSEKKLEREKEELKRRTAELNFLIKSTPGGVFQYSAEADEQFVFISDNMLKLLGYTYDQFVKKFDNRFSLMIYEEDRERVLWEINEQIADSDFDVCEYRVERADGTLIWVHDDGHVVTDENGKRWFYVIIVDITTQKRIEDALREKNEENAIVIAQSGKSVIRYNLREHTALHYGKISELLGITELVDNYPDSLLQSELIADESRNDFEQMFRDIRDGQESGSANVRMTTVEQGLRWFRVDYTTICDERGLPSHAILSIFDNTDVLEGEMAYEKLKSDLASTVAESLLYYEINLSRDIIERAEMKRRVPSLMKTGISFYDFLRSATDSNVYADDQPDFFEFLDRNRLFSLFSANVFEDSIELRINVFGKYRWCKLAVQLVKYPHSDELKAYVVLTDTDSARRERASLEELAYRDALTGILNRATLERRIKAAIEEMSENDEAAMFMIDLDNFKHINDTLGHQAGDETLRRQADAISAVFGESAIVGRLGGDEFMAYMPKNAPREIVEQKSAELVSSMQLSLGSVFVSGSVGASMMSGATKTSEQLYASADSALYRAKKSGKSGYCIAEEDEAAKEPADIGEVVASEKLAAVQFKTLVENIDAGILTFEVGEQNKVTYISPSFYTAMNRTHEEIGNGERLSAFIHPDDLSAVRIALRAALSGQVTECTYRTIEAEPHFRLLRAARISRQSNAVISVVTDITAIKRSERELSALEERYRMATELSGAMIWEVDITHNTLELSEEILRRHGLATARYSDVPASILSLGMVHSQSAGELNRLFSDIKGGVEGNEYFLRCRGNGSYEWLRATFRITFNEQGAPFKAIGVFNLRRDADADMAIFQNERFFMQLVCEHTLASMFVNLTSDSVQFHSMNISAYDNTSYTTLIKARREYISEADIEEYDKITSPQHLIGLCKGGLTQFYLDYRRKNTDGSQSWSRGVCRLLRHPMNGDVYAAIYFIDIGDRHDWEQQQTGIISREAPSDLYTKESFSNVAKAAMAGLAPEKSVAMSVLAIEPDAGADLFGTAEIDRATKLCGRLCRYVIKGDAVAGWLDNTHIALYQSNTTGEAELFTLLSKYRDNVLYLLTEASEHYGIGISCGFAIANAKISDFDSLLEAACAAAKRANTLPSRIAAYKPDITTQQNAD